MISYRRRHPTDSLRLISVWSAAIINHEFTDRELRIMCVMHVIQQDTNRLVDVTEIRGRTGMQAEAVESHIRTLIEKGAVERVSVGMLNLTAKGEYVLRGLDTILMRMVNNQKLSRWNRPLPEHEKYKRKPARKGKKVI